MSEVCSEVVVRLGARDRRQLAADLVALTKPRVVLMVLVTTLMGYDVALTGPADYLRMIHLLIGSLLAAGGTSAASRSVAVRRRPHAGRDGLPRGPGQPPRRAGHAGHDDPVPVRVHAAQATDPALHPGGRG